MIEATAAKLAAHIKQVVPEHPASIERMTFSLAVSLNLIMIVALMLVVSLVTGKIPEAIAAMLTFALLRQATGGVHLESGLGCIVVSTLLLTGLSYASFGSAWVFGLTATSILLILVFAPSRIGEQSRIPRRYYGKLKWGAAAAVALSALFMSPAVTAACAAQALSLIRTKGGGNLEKETV